MNQSRSNLLIDLKSKKQLIELQSLREKDLVLLSQLRLSSQNTNCRINNKLPFSPPSHKPPWSPPPPGALKLNSDAAAIPSRDCLGVGVVIRNDKGEFIAALSKPVQGSFSAEIGEILALREGLLLAKSLKIQVEWVEVDASNVADMINNCSNFSGPAGLILADVVALFADVGVLKCLAISRLGNGMAHTLASMASSSRKEQLWKDCCPPCLSLCL